MRWQIFLSDHTYPSSFVFVPFDRVNLSHLECFLYHRIPLFTLFPVSLIMNLYSKPVRSSIQLKTHQYLLRRLSSVHLRGLHLHTPPPQHARYILSHSCSHCATIAITWIDGVGVQSHAYICGAHHLLGSHAHLVGIIVVSHYHHSLGNLLQYVVSPPTHYQVSLNRGVWSQRLLILMNNQSCCYNIPASVQA